MKLFYSVGLVASILLLSCKGEEVKLDPTEATEAMEQMVQTVQMEFLILIQEILNYIIKMQFL